MDKLFGAYFFVVTRLADVLNRAHIRAQKEFKRSIKGHARCSWRWMPF